MWAALWVPVCTTTVRRRFQITNCSVKGSIDGAVTPGTVAGRAEGSTIESCTADVTIDENAGTEQVGTTTQMYESADQ